MNKITCFLLTVASLLPKIGCCINEDVNFDDWINDPSHAKLMAHKIPKSTLHIFDRCGHFAEDDQPELFFNVMDTFLEEK